MKYSDHRNSFTGLSTAALIGFTGALVLSYMTELNETLAMMIFFAGTMLGLAVGVLHRVGGWIEDGLEK